MPDDADFEYTGTDNLEVMADAINYNAFLGRLVQGSLAGATRIIDFGAGIGTFARLMQQTGHELLAVEPDERQRGIMQQGGIASVDDLSRIADGWADGIYTLNVLEHIEDDRAALAALHAKLRPGGRLLVYVPAFQVLYSSMDRKVGHCRRYHRPDLVAKLEQSGFRVLEARYVDSLGYPASLLYKWRGNPQGGINPLALRIYDRYAFPVSRLCDFLLRGAIGKNLYVRAIRR